MSPACEREKRGPFRGEEKRPSAVKYEDSHHKSRACFCARENMMAPFVFSQLLAL
ncbi:hypothetical protein HMPREF1508_1437 [Shuttleworthella sp. MSX8B]|nr:hypothetical protein HMPREF1508_1437 [Shuttleworthia sp. MSX8B]